MEKFILNKMNKSKMNKLAVSMMISYVILVSMTIGLSIAVYAWLKTYNIEPGIDCKKDTSIILTDYSCNNEVLEIIIKNNGRFNVDGFILTVAERGENLPITYLYEAGVSSLGKLAGNYHFDPVLGPGKTEIARFSNFSEKNSVKQEVNLSNISLVQIQPYMLSKNKKNRIICEEAVIKQSIEDCSTRLTLHLIPIPTPLAYFAFDDDNSDGIVNDLGSGNNDGTCAFGTTCPTYLSNGGKLGGAYDFDGIDDYIDVGDVSAFDFDGTQPFTISAWVKPTQVTGFDTIISKSDSTSGWSFQVGNLAVEAGDYLMMTFDTFEELSADNNNLVIYDLWTHVTVINIPNEPMRLFINGLEVTGYQTQNTVSRNPPTGFDFEIGRRHGGPSFPLYFTGAMDELKIWNVALSDEEIAQVYISSIS